VTHTLILFYIVLVYIRPQEYIVFLQGWPILPIVLATSFLPWIWLPNKSFAAPQFKVFPLFFLSMCTSQVLAGYLGGMLATLVDFGPIVILFILLATATNTLEQHRRTIRTIGVATVILAIHGILQASAGVGWSGALLSQETRITYVGIFSDPNDLALSFVIALPMLMFSLTETRYFLAKAFWLICILLALYGIFLTNSRGGMLAGITIALIYLGGRFGVAKALLGAAIGLAGLSMLPTRLDELDAKEESAADRLESWGQGLEMLKSHLLLGVGKGNFMEYHHLTAHNSFVLVFAEMGLIGYFLWLSFVAISVYMVYRVAYGSPKPGDDSASMEKDRESFNQFKRISKTYFNSMIGFLVGAFFLSRSYVVLLAIMCGLCVALYQAARLQWPSITQITLRAVSGAVLFIEFGSIFVIYLIVRFFS
jgi:putative inorganic carbon (hco3(-)) transporter